MRHDAIVVGGSFAGLSAATYIARGRRSVAVIDAGRPRNRFAAHSHGFLAPRRLGAACDPLDRPRPACRLFRVRLVIPGRAPHTAFSATARARSQNGIPEAYAVWAKQAFSAAPQHPTDLTKASDVAEAIWLAAANASSPFRIPAGADAVSLAARVA